jgi:hypothetical protein
VERKWRRLCVDLDVSGRVLGGSVEEYGGEEGSAFCIHVLALGETEGLQAHRVLDSLIALGWYQDELPFPDGRPTVVAWDPDDVDRLHAFTPNELEQQGTVDGSSRWGLA